MHACVELNMNGVRSYAAPSRFVDECLQQSKTVNLGLEPILKEGVEATKFRIHNHNGNRDAFLPQCLSLVSNGYGQVIAPVLLQSARHFVCSGTVAKGFDHTNHFGFSPESGTEIVEVMHHGVEVDLKNGFVNLFLQELGNPFEVEHSRTLEQYQFVIK